MQELPHRSVPSMTSKVAVEGSCEDFLLGVDLSGLRVASRAALAWSLLAGSLQLNLFASLSPRKMYGNHDPHSRSFPVVFALADSLTSLEDAFAASAKGRPPVGKKGSGRSMGARRRTCCLTRPAFLKVVSRTLFDLVFTEVWTTLP